MAAVELLEPVLGAGIQSTHYFNGRVLTAEDLRTDQDAQRSLRALLGTAIGDGVITGLDVSLSAAAVSPPGGVITLRVTRGVALNRDGDAVALGTDTDVALVKSEDAEAVAGGAFAVCQPPQATLTNPGLYILTILPASGTSGRAPMTELGGQGIAAGCGARFDVGGAQFRMVPLTIDTTAPATSLAGQIASFATQSDTQIVQRASLSGAAATQKDGQIGATLSQLRNRVAHYCLGGDGYSVFAGRLFEQAGVLPTAAMGDGIDLLRAVGVLQSCEVPLAVLYWSRRGVEFVDRWAVRREPRRPLNEVFGEPSFRGLEQLRQFEQHQADLLGSLANPTVARLEDFFRFVPPVATVPVRSPGSLSGFHLTTFLQTWALGASGTMDAGQVGSLLLRSFGYPAIDLGAQPPPTFQVIGVRQNQAAVTAASARQLYRVFVSRVMHGPRSQDGMAGACQDAWNVYRGILKRRLFLPPGNTAAEVTAQVMITSAVRDVTETAARQSGLAVAWAFDTTDALSALSLLHDVQQEMATVFALAIPGIVNTQGRETFAAQLLTLLNGPTASGAPSLAAALQSADLRAAVAAQNAINGFVGSWSGEGVAVGPFGWTYEQSPDGDALVPGEATPNRQLIRLFNSTNIALTMDLQASVTAPTGDWTGSTRLFDSNHVETNSKRLESGASELFTVEISAPAGASTTETATLTLTATVGPPTDRSVPLSRDLDINASRSGAVLNHVEFPDDLDLRGFDPTNMNNAPPRTFFLNVLYVAPNDPPSTTAMVQVRVALSTGWRASLAPLTFTRPTPESAVGTMQLTNNVADRVQITIQAPAATTLDQSTTLTIELSVPADTSVPMLSYVNSDGSNVTLTVRHI